MFSSDGCRHHILTGGPRTTRGQREVNIPETAFQRLTASWRNSLLIAAEKKQKKELPKEPFLQDRGRSDENSKTERIICHLTLKPRLFFWLSPHPLFFHLLNEGIYVLDWARGVGVPPPRQEIEHRCSVFISWDQGDAETTWSVHQSKCRPFLLWPPENRQYWYTRSPRTPM